MDNSRTFELVFEFKCSCTLPGDTVIVTGSYKALGCWDVNKAISLATSEKDFPQWKSSTVRGRVDKCVLYHPIEYKYLIRRGNAGQVIYPACMDACIYVDETCGQLLRLN
jgi:hypothetical protein